MDAVNKDQIAEIFNTHTLAVLNGDHRKYSSIDISDDDVIDFNLKLKEFCEKYPQFDIFGDADDYQGKMDDEFIELVQSVATHESVLSDKAYYDLIDIEDYLSKRVGKQMFEGAMKNFVYAANLYNRTHVPKDSVFEALKEFGIPIVLSKEYAIAVRKKLNEAITKGKNYILTEGERRFKFSVEEIDDTNDTITAKGEDGKPYKVNKQKMQKAISDGRCTEEVEPLLEADDSIVDSDGNVVPETFLLGQLNVSKSEEDFLQKVNSYIVDGSSVLGVNATFISQENDANIRKWYNNHKSVDHEDSHLKVVAEEIAKTKGKAGKNVAITNEEFLVELANRNLSGRHNLEGVAYHLAKNKVYILEDSLSIYRSQIFDILDEMKDNLNEGATTDDMEILARRYDISTRPGLEGLSWLLSVYGNIEFNNKGAYNNMQSKGVEQTKINESTDNTKLDAKAYTAICTKYSLSDTLRNTVSNILTNLKSGDQDKDQAIDALMAVTSGTREDIEVLLSDTVTELMHVTGKGNLEVIAECPDSNMNTLTVGCSAKVITHGNEEISGEVTEILPHGDVYIVKLKLPPGDVKPYTNTDLRLISSADDINEDGYQCLDANDEKLSEGYTVKICQGYEDAGKTGKIVEIHGSHIVVKIDGGNHSIHSSCVEICNDVNEDDGQCPDCGAEFGECECGDRKPVRMSFKERVAASKKKD